MSPPDLPRLVLLGAKFLWVLSTKPHLRLLMTQLGYSDEEHKLGWNLYLKMAGYLEVPSSPSESPEGLVWIESANSSQPFDRLQAFYRGVFRQARTPLRRLHPEQYQYIFSTLGPPKGLQWLTGARNFLDRYAALRDGTDPERAATREADKAAATTLENRRIINRQLEEELRECYRMGESCPTPVPARVLFPLKLQLQAAEEFKIWNDDWRAVAAEGIARRDYRIMLGITKRRKRSSPDRIQ